MCRHLIQARIAWTLNAWNQYELSHSARMWCDQICRGVALPFCERRKKIALKRHQLKCRQLNHMKILVTTIAVKRQANRFICLMCAANAFNWMWLVINWIGRCWMDSYININAIYLHTSTSRVYGDTIRCDNAVSLSRITIILETFVRLKLPVTKFSQKITPSLVAGHSWDLSI